MADLRLILAGTSSEGRLQVRCPGSPCKQASFIFTQPVKGVDTIDGYQLVLTAAATLNDPAMQFAAAVITQDKTARRAEYRDHLQRAMAAAKTDAALGASITKHFRDTGELR